MKEISELKEILPDIKAKIDDVEDEKKNMDDLKNLAKEALVIFHLLMCTHEYLTDIENLWLLDY